MGRDSIASHASQAASGVSAENSFASGKRALVSGQASSRTPGQTPSMTPGQTPSRSTPGQSPSRSRSSPGGGSTPSNSFSAISGDAPRQYASWRLFLAVGICCLSPLLFGFSLTFTSPAQATMEGQWKGWPRGRSPKGLVVFDKTQFAVYASLFNVGAVIGASLGVRAADKLGRKKALATTVLPHAISWYLTAMSSEFGLTAMAQAILLMCMRLLVGVAVGMGMAVTPCYIGEVSTVELRGVFSVANQMSVTLGIFLVNALGFYVVAFERDGQKHCDWRYLSQIGLGLSLVLGTILWMPESPKWLAKEGRDLEARLALRQLRACETATEEEDLMDFAEATEGTSTVLTASTFVHQISECRMSIFLAVLLLAFQQFSGINAILMYTSDILRKARTSDADFAVMLVLGMQLGLTAIACVLVERAGRRSLLQFAAATMCVAHLGLSFNYVAEGESLWAPSLLAPACVFLFLVGYSVGMGPVPWIILAEVFPIETVSTASSIATTVAWMCSLVVCFSFQRLQENMGPDCAYMLFSFVCFSCFVFVTMFVPETQGKTAEQVIAMMRMPVFRSRST